MMGRLALVVVLLAIAAQLCRAEQHGFANPDGTQDSYNSETGGWLLEWANPDGSRDTYDTRSRTWEYGFGNPDGSEDLYDASELGFPE